jgi:hypothetical protein
MNINYQIANTIHSQVVGSTCVAPWLLVEDETYVSTLADMVNSGASMDDIKEKLVEYVNNNY